MTRKRYLWKLTHSDVQLGDRTLIAGIVDLARASEPDRVFAQALQAEELGAGLLKLSGEDDPRVLVPVLKRLHGHVAVPVMVTTGRAGIAERSIQLGAAIICDPWSLSLDPELARVASRLRAGLVLAHMRGDPEAWARQAPAPDPVARMLRDLEAAVLRARRAGVEPGQLAVDPGLGLGKRREENAAVLAQLQ
ncbi:MAG: dihydropteroate synthase, partial [Bryobacteraceae bacterium]